MSSFPHIHELISTSTFLFTFGVLGCFLLKMLKMEQAITHTNKLFTNICQAGVLRLYMHSAGF